MAFRVEITPKAEQDLDSIFRWLLVREAGDAGIRWFHGIGNAIDSLSEAPRRCKIAEESKAFRFDVRQLLYGRQPHIFRILFTIENDTVKILRVRRGRRLPAR